MDVIAERTTEAELIVERASHEWLAGEVIRAMAPVSGLDFDRWKVRGLDDDGHERSIGGTIRGVGKIVKTSSVEFVKRTRRGPLAGRPEDAGFECRFELPSHALAGVARWKQPMVPELKNGPRFVQTGFADASWARVKTDESGLAALVPPLSHSAP